MVSIHPELRERELASAHGSPLLAAANLTLELSANRPDDGPEARLGWPLGPSIERALEVIAQPGLSHDAVKAIVISIARRQHLLLGGEEA